MGLFGSKKKTYVGTSVNRIIDDKDIPDSPKIGAIKGILQGNDIVDNILDEMLGSVGLKSDRMYEFAKKNYPHGVPTKTFQYRTKGLAQVQAILDKQHGKPVSIEYSRFGPPNLTHIGWMKLIKDYGYNTDTNEIVKLSTTDKVYLDNISMVLPTARASEYESGALEQWGKSPASGYKSWEPYNQDIPQVVPQPLVIHKTGIPDELIRISKGYLKKGTGMGASTPVLSTMDLATTGYIDTADYFHVKYKVDNKTYYWMYQQGIGTHPTLDTLFDNNSALGSFYPITYFRYGKKPMNQDKTSAAYKASKKMVKYLGMNYDQIIDMVHENPGIADVEQAMMIMAVPANTTDPMEQRYLYNFFNEMFLAVGETVPSASPYGSFLSLGMTETKNAVVIQDKLFKMGLNTSGLQKFMKNGIVAKVGDYNSVFGVEKIPTSYVNTEGQTIKTTVDVDYHGYRLQKSDNLYEEVRVYNLQMVYHIIGGYKTTGDDTDPILLIPLDRSIVDSFSVKDKEQLISRSLHFVFNSVQVVKLKWYQTGLFKAFMIVVAIVITVFSYGSAWAATASALAAGGAAAVIAIQAALIGVLNAMVYAYAFKLFVQAVGPEFALLVAIVAIAYGGYKFFTEGGGKNLFADNLLQVGNGMVKSVQGYYNNALEGLQNEFELFKSEAERLDNDLRKASDELLRGSQLSPMVIFGEKPSDFYNRTVHSGNIGVQSIAAVSNYFDIALQLPKLDETV